MSIALTFFGRAYVIFISVLHMNATSVQRNGLAVSKITLDKEKYVAFYFALASLGVTLLVLIVSA